MIVLLAALAASVVLLWGAYGLGRRSATVAVVGACLLVPIAWRIAQLDTSHGEGAAIGVVIIVVAVWALTALGVLLAVAMLCGAIRAHDSLVAKVSLGLVLLLGTPVLVGLSRTPTATRNASTAAAPRRANATRNTYVGTHGRSIRARPRCVPVTAAANTTRGARQASHGTGA